MYQVKKLHPLRLLILGLPSIVHTNGLFKEVDGNSVIKFFLTEKGAWGDTS